MKSQFYFLVLIATFLFSCKKSDKKPKPDTNNEKVQWQYFTTANSKLPNNQVNAIAISKSNVKWVGTADGLVSINGSTWTVFKTELGGLPSSNILSLAVQGNNNVWVGTDKGLAKFDGTKWTVYTSAKSIVPNAVVMSLTSDDLHGRVWAGTAKGIVEINADNQFTLHDETEGILPLSLTTDQNGALWIGSHEPFTFRGSIRKYQNGVWKTYQLDQMGYESAFPYAIAVDNQNNVIAALTGTATRAVIKFANDTWQELALPPNALGMRALALEQDKIWAGGVNFVRLSTAAPTVINVPAEHSTILSLATDTQGYKWLGTISGGLVVYHE